MECIILIDGDNINPSYLKPFEEYLVKRNYTVNEILLFGKTESNYVKDWKYLCDDERVKPYTVVMNKKNVTDVQLISVACQKIYQDNYKCICIMTSDMDIDCLLQWLPPEIEVIVGYRSVNTSEKFIRKLESRYPKSVDLEALRGTLTEEQIAAIVNFTKENIIEYKVCGYFSFTALHDWIKSRYSELRDITEEQIQELCTPLQINFSGGAKVLRTNTELGAEGEN